MRGGAQSPRARRGLGAARDHAQHAVTVARQLAADPGDALVDDWDRYRGLWEEAGGLFIHHTSARASIAALSASRCGVTT